MVVISVLNLFARTWWDQSINKRSLGIFLDISVFLVTVVVAVYLIEHDQVCLIDQITGERARLMAEDAARAKEQAAIFGTVLQVKSPIVKQRRVLGFCHFYYSQ